MNGICYEKIRLDKVWGICYDIHRNKFNNFVIF